MDRDVRFDVHELYKRLIELGRKNAEANARAELWEEGKKIKISEIYNSIQGDMSIAAKEKAVYCNEEYKSYIKKMLEIKKEADMSRIEYEAHKILIDMLRTEQSNRRAQMELETRM